MSGDMSACDCVDIGPVLVKPGPQTGVLWFCGVFFLDVLDAAASVAIEKVHDVRGFASHRV